MSFTIFPKDQRKVKRRLLKRNLILSFLRIFGIFFGALRISGIIRTRELGLSFLMFFTNFLGMLWYYKSHEFIKDNTVRSRTASAIAEIVILALDAIILTGFGLLKVVARGYLYILSMFLFPIVVGHLWYVISLCLNMMSGYEGVKLNVKLFENLGDSDVSDSETESDAGKDRAQKDAQDSGVRRRAETLQKTASDYDPIE